MNASPCFQLAPFGDMVGEDLPVLEMPAAADQRDRGPIMPVPKGIRPILSTHRIEVLDLYIHNCIQRLSYWSY